MIHHLTTTTILSSQKVVLTVTENKKQLINIIYEELQNDKDFIDSFSHEHTLLITREGDPVEITMGQVILRPDIFTSHEETDNIIIQQTFMAVEQGAECSSVMALMTLMSIFCCYIITIRKSSTFQCSWNPLFTKDKLQTLGQQPKNMLTFYQTF